MAARLLFVGDVHLGRFSARVPEAVREHDLDPAELSPRGGWRNVVAHACAQRYDAVVLAGDVVESDHARFEAWGPLKSAVETLVERGIDVVAVCGNHDVEALPRLAQVVPELTLLGAGGVWATHDVRRDGATVARLLGWSFPEPHVSSSPIDALRVEHDHSVPLLGVLHCEITGAARAGTRDAAARSRACYAPVTLEELSTVPVAGWFLGHLHTPTLARGGRPIGYLGSLVGLDPSERGVHGPWEVHTGDGELRLRHLPLAPLRWEDVEIEAQAASEPRDGLLRAIDAALEGLRARLDGELRHVRAVGCRLIVRGRAPCFRALEAALAETAAETICVAKGGVVFFVHDLENRARPARDLVAIARGSDPPGLLARDLLALESGTLPAAELIARARETLRATGDASAFRALAPFPATAESVRALLLDAGWLALEDLLAQREAQAEV